MQFLAAWSSPLAIEGADWQQIIVLLLFLFFGLGKAIFDKVRGPQPAARPGRRAGSPPSASPGPSASPVPAPRDVRELWDELVDDSQEELTELGQSARATLPEAAEPVPLGIDLLEVEQELPSHHEELFESYEALEGTGGRYESARIHQTAPSPRLAQRALRATELHAMAGDRIAWGRAIVLSEVLGTPLALRNSEQLPGLR